MYALRLEARRWLQPVQVDLAVVPTLRG